MFLVVLNVLRAIKEIDNANLHHKEIVFIFNFVFFIIFS